MVSQLLEKRYSTLLVAVLNEIFGSDGSSSSNLQVWDFRIQCFPLDFLLPKLESCLVFFKQIIKAVAAVGLPEEPDPCPWALLRHIHPHLATHKDKWQVGVRNRFYSFTGLNINMPKEEENAIVYICVCVCVRL